MSDWPWFKKKVGLLGWLAHEDEAHACKWTDDGFFVSRCGLTFLPHEMRSAHGYGMPCQTCKAHAEASR